MNATDHWIHEEADSDCYICNCSNKVHVFFRRAHVDNDFQKLGNLKTIDLLIEYYKLKKYRDNNPITPLMFGSITEWQPVKLMSAIDHTLLRLTHSLNKN